jgi:acetyl esterase/lipase
VWGWGPTQRSSVTLTFDDILALPAPTRDHRAEYGFDPQQFGDLRLPARRGGLFAVVVFIHGGCWDSNYDLSHANALAAALVELGVATWNLEYRRLGHVGGGWPGTFLDVAHGVDFVRKLARRHPLDVTRVIVMGHSAGGHLALWSAARARLPTDSPVATADPLRLRGVVSLAGIPDLRAAYERSVCDTAPGRLLGGSPAVLPDVYAQASASKLVPFRVPQRLLHGSRDATVPVSFSTTHADLARRAGDDARAVVIEDAGHFELICPTSAAWRHVQATVSELLGLTEMN